jgi:flagellar protein FlaG
MNTIISKAELTPVSTENTNYVNEKQIGQTNSVLTERAVDDVNTDTKAQNALSDKVIDDKNDENAASGMEREQLEKVAQQLQDFMGEMNHSLEFHVDEDSGRDVIKVLDKNSGDVIKQYPSEEVLDVVAKLSETAGLLIDQTV